MYAADKDVARAYIREFRAKIDEEHCATIERVNRLKQFDWNGADDKLEQRVRDEWATFRARTAPLEEEIAVIIKALANALSLEAPPPTIIAR